MRVSAWVARLSVCLAVGATGQRAFASPDFLQLIYGVPDFDQRRVGLDKDGSQHCAPTRAMDHLYYFGLNGWPSLVASAALDAIGTTLGLPTWGLLPASAYTFDKDHGETTRIELLGAMMGTGAHGTPGKGYRKGLRNWFSMQGLPPAAFPNLTWSVKGKNVSPESLVPWLKLNGMVGQSITWYGGPNHVKTGSHATALVGVGLGPWVDSEGNPDGSGYTVYFNDPGGGDGDPNVQGPFHTEAWRAVWSLSKQEYCHGPEQLSTATWGCFEYYSVVVPLFGVTNSEHIGEAAWFQTAATEDGFGSLSVQDFQAGGAIDDMTFRESSPHPFVASAAAGVVYQLQTTASGRRVAYARIPGARLLTSGGPDERLYVLGSSGLIALDSLGQAVAAAEIPPGVSALAYDQVGARIVAASSSLIRFFDLDLMPLGELTTLPLLGDGALLLDTDPVSGELVLMRRGSPIVMRLRTEGVSLGDLTMHVLAGASAPQALAVDAAGNELVIDAGVIKTFDARGVRLPGASALDGAPSTGTILRIARGGSTVDPRATETEDTEDVLPASIYGDESTGEVGVYPHEETPGLLPDMPVLNDHEFLAHCLDVGDTAGCEETLADTNDGLVYMRVFTGPDGGERLALWKGRALFEQCGGIDVGPFSGACRLRDDGTPQGRVFELPLRSDGLGYVMHQPNQGAYTDASGALCDVHADDEILMHRGRDGDAVRAKLTSTVSDSCTGTSVDAMAIGFEPL